MTRLLLLACSWVVSNIVFAQNTSSPQKTSKVDIGGTVSLMGSQSGSRNWSQGAEKFTLSGVASANLFLNKIGGANSFENSLDLAYGIMNSGSMGVRKVDDKIDLYSRYSYSLNSSFGVGVVGNLRTQFSDGYDYNEDPKKRISGFFAPAWLTASPGAQWKPAKGLVAHFGPAARWIIITNNPYSLNYQGGIKPDGSREQTLSELYNVNPGREVRIEIGPYMSTTFQREIMKNVSYRGRLDLMLDMLNQGSGKKFKNWNANVDVYWTNNFLMTVNKWLKVAYSFDLVYDDNVRMFGPNKRGPATQMKSILGVGLATSF